MKKIYPFKFLDAYTKDDTSIFFGRDEEINSLYEMVFQTDILLVYGASGTGKTSLIQCGLASKFQSHDWLALNIRRGNNLNESFDKALKEAGGESTGESNNNGQDWLSVREDNDEQASVKELSPLELSFRAIYLQYFRPIYLIFDQFEELYILGNKQEQDEFIKNVQEILKVEQPVKMIFSIREEYLGQLEKFEKAVPQLLRKKLRVEPMNFEKVSQVIKGATGYEDSNVRLKSGEEPTIMEGIFDKLKGGQKLLTIELPYLQVFLDKLYMIITKDDERQTEAVFTMEELNKLGDIGDVLREFLEEQVKSISQNLIARDSDATVENIWKILSPFVTLEGTKEPISRKSLQDRLPGINDELIDRTVDAFVNRRILRKSEKEDMYEIAHDSLAQRIAEKRTTEENSLLEIARIIKNQTFLKGEVRELFSEKKLNLVEPYLQKLREQKLIDEDGEDLIEQSRKKIEQDKEEKVAAQQKELKIANERAKEEEELRKAAETSKEKAVESENKAKKRSRYAAMAAIAVAIIAIVAFIYYLKAQAEKLQNNQYEYAIKNHFTLLTKVDGSLKEILIDTLYSLQDSTLELKNSVLLSAKGLDNKSIKTTQAAYLKYPNRFTEKGLENIAKMIIMPKVYDSLGKYFDKFTYTKIATSNDNKNLIVTNDFFDGFVNGSKLVLFNKNDIKPIDSAFLENTFINTINYSINSNHLAIISTGKKIYILNPNLDSVCKFNLDSILVSKLDSSLVPKGVISKFIQDEITNTSFILSKDLDAANVLVNSMYSGSVLLYIENLKSKHPRLETVIYTYQQMAFINDTLIYSIDGTIYKFDKKEKSLNLDESINDITLRDINRGELSYDAKKLRNSFETSNKDEFFSIDRKIKFEISNDNLNQSENSYFLTKNDSVRILGINTNILHKVFSNDNHLFTITEDKNLLEWDFDSPPLGDKSELLSEQSPLAFTIVDRVIYQIMSIDEIPESTENIEPLKKLSEHYSYIYPDDDSIALSIERVLAKINYKLYKIDSLVVGKTEIAENYGTLADHLIFHSKFEEALDAALLGIKLDSSITWIYANIALGYLLTSNNTNNNMVNAKEIYLNYKDSLYFDGRLCEAFLTDFDKLKEAGIVEEGDERIREIRDLLKDCK